MIIIKTVPHLSACVDSVHTALAALVPVIRLPVFPSRPRPPLLLSLSSSWMDRGWMTGWLRPRSEESELGSQLSSSPRSTPAACWLCWVMVVREGGCEELSLKWVCSRELMYSVTLREKKKEIEKRKKGKIYTL